VSSDLHEEQKKHLDTLLKQGDFLLFSEQEKCDSNWKSVLFNLPKGTIKFLLNSFINTLPTQDNLKLWGEKIQEIQGQKYAQFETDIKHYDTKVIAFEVGSRGGLTDDNVKRLADMHKHMQKHIKKKQFIEKIKCLATLGSYYLYTARKHQTWSNTSRINPPF
jgi:hypothetical protein